MNPTSGVISEAWEIYKRHWQHLLAFSLVVYVAVALISGLLGAIFEAWLAAPLAAVVVIIGLFWLEAALVKAVEDVHDGKADRSLAETFGQARAQLPAVVVASILAAIGIVVGLILLVVPGLVLLTWWCVIIPVIVLENKSSGEAFGRSRELVRGHGWNVFGVIVLVVLLLIGFDIALRIVLTPLADWLQSFLSSFVSGTLTAPFVATVLTLLYFRLRDAKKPQAQEPPPPPTPGQ
jgi:glycerophosphoryl diester phosphodiesterase family protein